MSDTSRSDTKSGARITIRIAERELASIRQLADGRGVDMATVVREAIAAFFDKAEDRAALRAEHDRLMEAVTGVMRQEVDRAIRGHQQAIRSLIAALNEHLARR